MKKAVTICGGVFLVSIALALALADYKIKHKRYIVIPINND